MTRNHVHIRSLEYVSVETSSSDENTIRPGEGETKMVRNDIENSETKCSMSVQDITRPTGIHSSGE